LEMIGMPTRGVKDASESHLMGFFVIRSSHSIRSFRGSGKLCGRTKR
jgi:hypothetical protein